MNFKKLIFNLSAGTSVPEHWLVKESPRTHQEDNIAILHIIFGVSQSHCRLDSLSR